MSETTTTADNSVLAESIRRKFMLRDLKKANEDLRQQVAERDKQIEAMGVTAEEFTRAPDALRAELDALKSERRNRVHLDAWRKLASEAHVRSDAVEALYKLSGYAPEQDDVDERQIGKVLGDSLKQFPFLGEQNGNGAKLTPSPAADRGGDLTESKHVFTRKEVSAIVRSPRKAEYVEAYRSGTLTIVD